MRRRILILAAANIAIAVLVFFSTGIADSSRLGTMPLAAIRGQKVWQAHNCISCHAIYGLGGHMGPDLTNVLRRIDKEDISLLITEGFDKMPPETINNSDIKALIAYFNYLNSSGEYPVKSFPAGGFGHLE